MELQLAIALYVRDVYTYAFKVKITFRLYMT